MAEVVYHFLGEVLRVGIRYDAPCLITQRKLGVTESVPSVVATNRRAISKMESADRVRIRDASSWPGLRVRA